VFAIKGTALASLAKSRDPLMIRPILIRIRACLRSFHSRKGQALVEYALVLSFISVLSISCLSVMSAEIRGAYVSIIDAISAALTSVR
jgi:Flp pilus assembly pilin Flp